MTERPELFRGRDYLYLLSLFLVIFFLSLSKEYYFYKKLVSQKKTTLTCKVVNQYIKTGKEYYILKLKCDDSGVVYTSKGRFIGDIRGKNITAQFWLNRVDFTGYLKGFYAKSKILHVEDDRSFKSTLNAFISAQHENRDAAAIYKALFTADTIDKELQQKLSSLGVSHLMAISGFHLGVLSAVLFFIFGALYRPVVSRCFPYRHSNRDLFVAVAFFLLVYVWFLDFTPSLLRSFAMLVVGYILFDRGLKILSMQTLLLTLLLLIAFIPKLLFSLGFWLSVSGVFYIFLFLIYFGSMKKLYLFLLLPLFVYVAMVPFSIYFFGLFSLVHPLSIIWTTLFTLFYPLSILLHASGFGGALDGALLSLLKLSDTTHLLHVSGSVFSLHVGLSLLALWHRAFFYGLSLYSSSFLVYAVYYVT